MAELISGDLPDDLAGQNVGPEATQGEALGAAASSAWNSLPMVKQSNIESDRALAGTAPTTSYGGGVEDMGYDPDTENLPHSAPNTISADDANKDLPAGMAPFTAPVNPDARDAMVARHNADARSADIVSRGAQGIINNPVTRFATGALVSLADPLNDMAMMIPVAPEAFTAARLAAAGGFIERGAIRAGLGAAQGAAGMAALQPLQYLQDSQDHEAFDIGEALRQVAFGAFAGGLGGAVHSAISDRISRLDPEAQLGLARASLADVMNDRPVDVAPILDHAEASQAADNLEKWHGEQQRILSDADAARPPSTFEVGNEGAIEDARTRMEQAHEQAGQLRGEIGKLPAVDPETQSRLDEIQRELDGVIPSARRASLEQERGMLQANGPSDLDTARTEVQRQGLTAAAERSEGIAGQAEDELVKLRAQETAAQAEAQANRTSQERATRIAQAKIDSREQVVQSLMEREVRRYAGRVGATIDPAEVASIAREVRTAQPAEVGDIISNHLQSISERGTKTADVGAAPPATTTPTGTLRAEAQGAAVEMAQRRSNPTPDQDVVRSQKANDASVKAAPKLGGDPSRDLAEVEKMLADKEAEYKAQHVEPAPVREGYVRMYHGGVETEEPVARWLSQDRKYAEGYASKAESEGKIFYIDLPENSPHLTEASDTSGTGMKKDYAHVEIPPELAKNMRQLPSREEPPEVTKAGEGILEQAKAAAQYATCLVGRGI